MTILDGLVGRYLRGEVGVYRGTVMARDTRGIYATPLDPTLYTDRMMSSSGAIASLVIHDAEPQATLTVFSPSEAEYVLFGQSSGAPGVTTAVGILADNQSGGPVATCAACAPDLLVKPAMIAWTDEDAVVTVADVGADYHIVSSVSLELAPACSLTWDDLAALDATTDTGRGLGLGAFSKVGGSMVLHTGGMIETVAPSAPGSCGQYVAYTVDLYVDVANLSDYGLRNYVAQPPQTFCPI